MAGEGAGGQGWWSRRYLEGHPQIGEALQRKALGAGESDGSRGPTGALSTPEEGGLPFQVVQEEEEGEQVGLRERQQQVEHAALLRHGV